MAVWGLVIGAIAAIEWHGLHRLRDVSGAARLERLLWMNIGLDAGYVAMGVALACAAWVLGAQRLAGVGAGVGIIVQGLAPLAHRSAVRRRGIEIAWLKRRLDLRHEPKDRAYAAAARAHAQVLAGIDDDVAGMATMSALIHHAFGHLWTGFYRVVVAESASRRTVSGHARLPRDRVRAGRVRHRRRRAADDRRSRRRAISRPHHVRRALKVGDRRSCVRTRSGALIAVLDVDSDRRAAFDQQDAAGLERIVRWFAGEGSRLTRRSRV